MDAKEYIKANPQIHSWVDLMESYHQAKSKISDERIDELTAEYSTGHYTDTESIKQAYNDYYIGFTDAIKELNK